MTEVTEHPDGDEGRSDAGRPAGAGENAGASGKRILAGFFWLLASLGIMVGGVTLWAHQSVLTSDGWTSIVSEVASDPEVIENTSTVIVERISENIGLQERVVDVLPGEMDLIGATITDRVEAAIAGGVARVASTDTFQEAFVNVNRLANDAAMRVIRGGGDVVSSDEGSIELNVFPLIGAALTGLQDAGFIDESREIPDLTEYQPDEENVARLESLLDRQLPDDLGTITLVDSERLGNVQTAVRNFDAITVALLLLTLLAIALALWLSAARVRMVLWLAIGAIVALLLGRGFTRVIVEDITGALREGPEGATVKAVIDATVEQLLWFTFAIIVIALIVAGLAMWYQRHEAQAVAAEAGEPIERRTLREWLRANLRTITYAGLGIIAFAVLWVAAGPDVTLLAGAAVGVWLIGMNLLAARAEEHEPSPGPT